MKKTKLTALSLSALLIILLPVLFFNLTRQNETKAGFNKNFNIGVIETTEQDNESYITFYNEAFQKIQAKKIEMGSMGSPFDLPRVYGRNMYVIPKGIGALKDLTVLMEYNMDTGEYKTYDMKQPGLNSFSVDSRYVYTANTLNYTSKISRCDRNSGEIKAISIKDTYVSRIDLYGDRLYVFAALIGGSETEAYLYLIDTKDFKIMDKIDITKYGISQYYSARVGDSIYFTNQTELMDNNEQGTNNLCRFNIRDKTLSNIKLKESYPFQILEYKDKLIISHFDMVQARGRKITIYDPKSGNQQSATLDNDLNQILIRNDKLYSMDNDNMYVYSISGSEFKLINKVDVHTKRENDKKFYLAGFFLNQ